MLLKTHQAALCRPRDSPGANAPHFAFFPCAALASLRPGKTAQCECTQDRVFMLVGRPMTFTPSSICRAFFVINAFDVCHEHACLLRSTVEYVYNVNCVECVYLVGTSASMWSAWMLLNLTAGADQKVETRIWMSIQRKKPWASWACCFQPPRITQVSAFSCYASMHAALEPISVHLLTQEWTKDGNQQSLSKSKSPVSFLQPKEHQRAMFVYACKNCCECLDPFAIIKSRALHSCKTVP